MGNALVSDFGKVINYSMVVSFGDGQVTYVLLVT